ncbi:hypothetical protein Tc00.1047053506667.170 [Trypanosoma cruzi]|uniref:Uncharacterized protein n=1 Tax=Trypanosoma cruzi (strain CL Brener) TaxID=353153 RepID=Q4DMA3_TRYCC|nr:hypothetical protein Tc00.1047053506667.170 [Trypanosoma cruzi]EAN93664.1 hypothetical protein Tc00.1047053506667.170 [Trypanosoma cruzi]|eukprot:XP_815515.1 hypothetical protein [Trypanosoma cruzi strain CL Brener]
MHIAVDLSAPFAVHAGSCVWRLLSSSVAMRRSEEEGARSPSLLSCGCDAPRVAALSWAPCPTEGGMAGNFVAASWMDEGPLARVAGVVGACSVSVVWWPRGFGHFPGAVAMSWGEMVVDVFSSCMVGGCWRCVPSLGGCRLVVCEVCGWACFPLLMLSALSRCIRCTPSLSLLLHSFPSDSSDSTTGDDDCDGDDGDGAAPCGARRVGPCALAAAGSPGDVSGAADAVVVPVDVSCAPTDGSLSCRVRVGVEEVFCSEC